jgi:DNA-binding response OmpR family regulator
MRVGAGVSGLPPSARDGGSRGDVEIDFSARCARRAGKKLDMTALEWRLIEALAQRAGAVRSDAELRAALVDAGVQTTCNAIRIHACNLRRKLGADAIQTIRGRGYRLVTGPTVNGLAAPAGLARDAERTTACRLGA